MSHTRLLLTTAATALLATPAAVSALPAPGGGLEIEKNGSGFDATATLRADGRAVRVTGPVHCLKGRTARLDVTLTQRRTGALARGTWRGTCKGVKQTWTLKSARVGGGAAMTPGSATACAAAVTRSATRATDAVQWCESLKLVAA